MPKNSVLRITQEPDRWLQKIGFRDSLSRISTWVASPKTEIPLPSDGTKMSSSSSWSLPNPRPRICMPRKVSGRDCSPE